MGVPEFSISQRDFAGRDASLLVLDVRKEPAFRASGSMIPAASWRHPFEVDSWADGIEGAVVVYCVHGHEVSHGVAAYLRARGIDARYLEGGFEAYVESGGDTVAA